MPEPCNLYERVDRKGNSKSMEDKSLTVVSTFKPSVNDCLDRRTKGGFEMSDNFRNSVTGPIS